jgi:hypothetical protein
MSTSRDKVDSIVHKGVALVLGLLLGAVIGALVGCLVVSTCYSAVNWLVAIKMWHPALWVVARVAVVSWPVLAGFVLLRVPKRRPPLSLVLGLVLGAVLGTLVAAEAMHLVELR